MSEINLGTAFLAGVVSFISPCVLPLIPGYISMISGVSFKELKDGSPGVDAAASTPAKAGLAAILFVVGFSIVFTLMGAFASGIGRPLAQYLPWFKKIAGILIMFFGLHIAGLLSIRWLNLHVQIPWNRLPTGPVGAFLMGLAFAVGWIPCVGPILAAILALATTEEAVFQGMLLLFVYSLGIGIPFILTGFSVGAFLRVFHRYGKYARYGAFLAGLLLVAIGALIFTDRLSVLIPVTSFFSRFSL